MDTNHFIHVHRIFQLDGIDSNSIHYCHWNISEKGAKSQFKQLCINFFYVSHFSFTLLDSTDMRCACHRIVMGYIFCTRNDIPNLPRNIRSVQLHANYGHFVCSKSSIRHFRHSRNTRKILWWNYGTYFYVKFVGK